MRYYLHNNIIYCILVARNYRYEARKEYSAEKEK